MKRDNAYLMGNSFARGSGGSSTSFKKGHVPWCKGKRGLRLSPATEFKKGQKSVNWLPVGYTTKRTDKSKKKRLWTKVAEPNVWTENCKVVWMESRGEIPKGFLIHHIDGNTLNDSIENLALVTRAGHFEIHQIGRLGRLALQKKRIASTPEPLL